MADAKPKIPPPAGYTYTTDGRFVFDATQMAQLIERLRWANKS